MSDMTSTPPPPPPGVGAAGPVGTVRSPIVVLLLGIVTCGIYTIVWYYSSFKELKEHTGEGIGGGIALLIAILISPVLLFLLPAEIASMYKKSGQESPVSAMTGLWNLLPLIGTIVWLWKVQGAMNARWQSAAA